MMNETPTDLYNLDIGESTCIEHISPFTVGPFRVSLIPEYKEARLSLPKQEQREEWIDDQGKKRARIASGELGGWNITATASLFDAPEKSFLAYKELEDNGVWDLCEVLTFLTGRRVSCEPYLTDFHVGQLGYLGTPVLETTEFIAHASTAWNSRHEFESQGLGYALFAYNEGLAQNNLHIMTYLFNLSLEILMKANKTETGSVLSTELKNMLKEKTSEIILTLDLCEELREALNGKLRNAIDEGPSTAVSRLKNLLRTIGVIEAKPNTEVSNRVQFINRVRNLLIHTGKVPNLKGHTQDESERITGAIVTGIVPNICRISLATQLGYDPNDHRKLRQFHQELCVFFEHGTWREWNFSQDFSDWFYEDVE